MGKNRHNRATAKEHEACAAFSQQANVQQKTEGSLETSHKYQRAKAETSDKWWQEGGISRKQGRTRYTLLVKFCRITAASLEKQHVQKGKGKVSFWFCFFYINCLPNFLCNCREIFDSEPPTFPFLTMRVTCAPKPLVISVLL